ncbi:MAG: c-type cytochrome [Bacteroidetes bacterium]|nr:c-type cytochrome [Bacteroidota bacterium]
MNNKFKNLRLILAGGLVMAGHLAWAQTEAAAESGSPLLNNIYDNMLLYAGFAVVAVAILSMFYLLNTLIQVQKMKLLQEHGAEVLEKADLLKRDPLWKRLYDRWTAAVPVEEEKDILMDHDYDGIRELDNRLPPWWVAIFYISIAFSAVYLVMYHFTDYGVGSREAYEMEMKQAEEDIEEWRSKQADLVDETNAEMLEDEAEIALGQTLFETNCVACHGPNGEGIVGVGMGPNLTDEYWLHGGGVKNIFKTVKYGVEGTGMIAWKAQLRAKDIHRVSSYIWSLQGTNPPNPRPVDGEIYVPEDEPMASDSTSTEEAEALGMKDEE